jgi:hypothetical protein
MRMLGCVPDRANTLSNRVSTLTNICNPNYLACIIFVYSTLPHTSRMHILVRRYCQSMILDDGREECDGYDAPVSNAEV